MERKTDPLVSVLMPVYNSEKYLSEAIESILNQTFTDFEFLIFDDGSTDSSKSIIEKFGEKDNRILPVFSNENKGYVVHLNEGLKIAKGKYIARMDSDDISFPDRFKMQVEYLESHPKAWVVGSSSIIINQKGEEINKSERFANPDEIYFISFFVNPISHPTVIFRKNEISAIGGYNVKKLPSEDFDLWTRILNKGEIANIKEPLLKYREHEASISVKKRELQKRNSHETLKNYWERELNVSIDEEEILFLREFHKKYDDLPKKKAYPLFNKILILISTSRERKILFKTNEINSFINTRLIYLLINARHHSISQMLRMTIKFLLFKSRVIISK